MVSRPGNDLIQLQLLADYATNPPLYPQLHAYLRESEVPVLTVWVVTRDFGPAAAAAFTDDSPNAEVHLLDGGHSLLESQLEVRRHTCGDFCKGQWRETTIEKSHRVACRTTTIRTCTPERFIWIVSLGRAHLEEVMTTVLTKLRSNVTHSDVVRKAIEEFDRLGSEAFFAAHGYGPSRTYELVWRGRRYPTTLGTAYEFATGHRLSPGDFEGGKAGAVSVLEEPRLHPRCEELIVVVIRT